MEGLISRVWFGSECNSYASFYKAGVEMVR